MSIRYGKYEYEKIEITKRGEDFRTWEYRIRNTDSGVEFRYIIEITKTALSVEASILPDPIPQTIESEGEYLVKMWLNDGREERIRAIAHSRGIGVD
jgi:hypothetical protein